MSPVKNRRHTMDKAQLAYNKRIAKKIQTLKEDTTFVEGLLAEWEEWLVRNADKDFSPTDKPMPIAMPFWLGDKWKHRAERGGKLREVAAAMVADYKNKIAINTKWIATAEKFLAEVSK